MSRRPWLELIRSIKKNSQSLFPDKNSIKKLPSVDNSQFLENFNRHFTEEVGENHCFVPISHAKLSNKNLEKQK